MGQFQGIRPIVTSLSGPGDLLSNVNFPYLKRYNGIWSSANRIGKKHRVYEFSLDRRTEIVILSVRYYLELFGGNALMFAVIESGGQKYTVEEGVTLKVPRLTGAPGEKIKLDKVLLVSDGKSPLVGTPYLANATVDAELVTQGRDEKITIFKYKRRTKYRLTRGHRQQYSELKITKIHAPK